MRKPPTHADEVQARAYILTAIISRAAVVAAVAAGVWSWARYGPLAGLAAFGLALMAAKACKAPMPDDLADKFR